MDKEELRAVLKQSRLNLSLDEVASKSARITELALDNIDWPATKSLHVYSTVADWREVDTLDLVRKVSVKWPLIKIVQPQLSRDNPIPKESFDVIIVPTLGFDENRNRLGLGGGWYDKFLATQLGALKVGLAYHFGLIKSGIPTEEHDIRLDKIITEQGII